jgi:hypothetical protein
MKLLLLTTIAAVVLVGIAFAAVKGDLRGIKNNPNPS